MKHHIVVLDFEYYPGGGGQLELVCLVAFELNTGRNHRVWLEGAKPSGPPFPCGPNTILVAHTVAPDEARRWHALCWHALGWPEPGGWIDTYAEERILAKGARLEGGFGLLACCRRRDIRCISPEEKSRTRDLILGGGSYTADQREVILAYCESNVREGAELFKMQLPHLSIDQALVRGHYLSETSRIGDRGLPVDGDRYRRLHELGNHGLRLLIAEHLDPHGFVVGGSFDTAKFTRLVTSSGIDWPLTESGLFCRDKGTLKDMARIHGDPWTGIHELIRTLSAGVVDGLKLRVDGRLYADPRPFGSITGRCTPSTSAFLWAGPKWLRSLLQPGPGRSILYVDWDSQEYAIAAALSQDPAMIEAYLSGDPYLALARKAGAVPECATKHSHADERDIYKVVSLAVLMGMGMGSIGRQTRRGRYGEGEVGRGRSTLHFLTWRTGIPTLPFSMKPPEIGSSQVPEPRETAPYGYPQTSSGSELPMSPRCPPSPPLTPAMNGRSRRALTGKRIAIS